MESSVGLWIDHRKAVIVSLGDKGEEIREIPSNMEKHIRFSGGAEGASAEDQRDRKFTKHLNTYYDAVVACIREAKAIIIFGPGEAKIELKKRLQNLDIHGHIVEVETVDKMTDKQIAAKVRQHFLK